MRRRRGEGHVEYLLISGLVAVCAIVSLWSTIDAIKIEALSKRICIECPEDPTNTSRTFDEHDRDAANEEAGETGETGETGDTTTGNDSSNESPLYSWMPPWLRDMWYWFSGAPAFYDAVDSMIA